MLKIIKANKIGILLLLFYAIIYSQSPRLIAYLGILTDSKGSTLPNGKYSILFEIFSDSSGGSRLWKRTKDLIVYEGMFEEVFGLRDFDALQFSNKYWFSVSLNGKALHPRYRLTGTTQFIKTDTANAAISANISKNADTTTYVKLIEIIQQQQRDFDKLVKDVLNLERRILDLERLYQGEI